MDAVAKTCARSDVSKTTFECNHKDFSLTDVLCETTDRPTWCNAASAWRLTVEKNDDWSRTLLAWQSLLVELTGSSQMLGPHASRKKKRGAPCRMTRRCIWTTTPRSSKAVATPGTKTWQQMHLNSRRARILAQEVRRLHPHLLVRHLMRLLHRRLHSCDWMMIARQARRLLVGSRGHGDRRFLPKRLERDPDSITKEEAAAFKPPGCRLA